jgi:hypothetical protein
MTTLVRHLDGPMSEADFAALERELEETTDQDLADFFAFVEQLWLEGAMFSDGCPGCVFQAANGSRATSLARAEVDRRN